MTDHPARLRRDVAWNLIPVAMLAGVGLGLQFLVGRWWGKDALGTFNEVTTAWLLVTILGVGGLQYAVLRAVAEQPDDRERVAAVVVGALVPNLVLAAVATTLFIVIRHQLAGWLDNPAVADGMLWAAPGLACFAINKVLLNVVNGLRRMRAFAVYTSLRYGLIAVGLVLARALGLPPAHLPAIWTFTEGVLLLVLVVELLATVSLSRARGWRTFARQHLGYGARGVAATLAYELVSKLDFWLVGFALPAQIGIYAPASAMFEGAMQLPVVLQNNLNPVIARHLALGERAEVEALIKRSRRWFVPAMLGCCAVGAAIYPFVVPWLMHDAAFSAGAWPFALLMAGLAIASWWLPFNQILMMGSRPGVHTVLLLTTLAATLIAGSQLIPRFELVGAAGTAVFALVFASNLLRALSGWALRVRV